MTPFTHYLRTAPRTKLGTELHPDDRAEVLRRYSYRMTVETQRKYPAIARYMRNHGYKMGDRTDAEWLAATRFRVRKDGRLDARQGHCETSYRGPQ